MRVSLCCVVFNEEHRIEKFLDNVRPHVDEIVIVDQSSTDGTEQAIGEWFLKNQDTRVLVVPDKHWGYCEPSRKLAHQHSTGDWILVLDADERISDNTVKFIRALRSDHPSIGDTVGVNLKRSLWVGGVHYWTGDYQFRLFDRDAVRYLDELHTEPQSTIRNPLYIYSPEFVGIWHEKSWTEQIRDEKAYSELITSNDPRRGAKLALNVYSQLLEAAGLTAEQADEMSLEERIAAGIGPSHEPHEVLK